MTTTTSIRRAAAVVLAAGLLFGAAACGSSDGSDGASGGGTTAPGAAADPGSSDTTASGDGEAAAVDPCQWYTAAEMEALLGFPVTMEDQTVGASVKCVYDAPDVYSSVEISPRTPEEYAAEKALAESPDGIELAGEVIAVDGVGDEGWGHSSPGGADIGILQGDKAISVLITTGAAREGEGSGNLATSEGTLEIAKQIATKALG